MSYSSNAFSIDRILNTPWDERSNGFVSSNSKARTEIRDMVDNKSKNDDGYVLAVGIDRLSFFNETLGAKLTDLIIEKTHARLQEILGKRAIINRVGGDVFGVFINESPSSEMPSIAQSALSSFQNEPIEINDRLVHISVSIGGALRSECACTSLLVSRAEMALRKAKDAGRGRFVQYATTPCQTKAYNGMIDIGNMFLKALKEDRLGLAFQQIVGSQSNKVSFHECLIRIMDEDGKVHRAAEFMPAIEELGLVRILDQAAAKMVIRELSTFQDLRLSLNVSHDSITDMNWLRGVVSALRDNPSVAKRLIVEITESAVMKDPLMTQGVVRTLKDLGCRIALDDFGSGYTAFSQIQDLEVDIVKIDQTFVRKMKQKNNHLFIRALQSLADGINIETVGEGAETVEEANILANDGVTHIQGYVHGVPSMERLWLPNGHVHRNFMGNDGKICSIAG